MLQSIAAKLKKIKLDDDLYYLRFVDVVKNGYYDKNNHELIGHHKGLEEILPYIGDYEAFDDYYQKFYYTDLLYADDIKATFDTDDEQKVSKMFSDMYNESFMLIYVDRENELVKFIKAKKDKLINCGLDLNSLNFNPLSTPDGGFVIMNEPLLKIMYSYSQKGDLDSLQQMITYVHDVYFENLYQLKNDIKNNGQTKEEVVYSTDNDVKQNSEDKTVEQLINELNSLVGLESVKKDVMKIKKFLEYNNATKDQLCLEKPNLNMIFQGPSGSGKTTVARIMAQILNKLGYTSNDRFIETTSKDFIGGYAGQTALKSQKLLKENEGSVIFIDEAYSFASEGQLFANEALAEILKEMEKNDTIFIFAGYEKEMKAFVDMNSGIASRIGSFVNFQNYSLDQLMKMLENKIEKSNLTITEDAKEELKSIIKKCLSEKNFGNGRFIDKLYNQILLEHANNIDINKRENLFRPITVNDISGLGEEKLVSKTKTIGFKGEK